MIGFWIGKLTSNIQQRSELKQPAKRLPCHFKLRTIKSECTTSILVINRSNSAGTLKNRAVTLSHLRRCQCAVFLVNMSDKSSFDIVKYLYEEYKQNWSGQYKGNCLLLANQGEGNQKIGGGGWSGANPVEAFCKSNGIQYRDISIRTNPKQAREFVETFLLGFCRDNIMGLQNEKRGLEIDTGSSCRLI